MADVYGLRALTIERDEAVELLRVAREALAEFAEHASHRCADRGRWPWEPHCPCGLTKALDKLHIEVLP